eukprot:TRINITY_DN6354_c0_g1_i1.p1 TRINITY_DN6354_c0_g1~~TRINITY_DN6354_c0_g1_i1.p1  ORF type:complete len:347 (+),score=56.09 TRINITY_DN6354_c0_g1_i1:101-1141(+)
MSSPYPTTQKVSDIEQAIVDEINLARTRPRDFAGYVHSTLRNGDSYFGYEELFNVLRVRSPVVPIKVNPLLSNAARKRAESVSNGVHVSVGDLYSRVSKYCKVDDPSCLKEVVWVGRGGDVRKLILSILADDNNPTRSRRTALLSATSTVAGIACCGNVLCVVLSKGVINSASHPTKNHVQYGTNHVFTSHAALPDEPVQQKPVRQVMTPTNNIPTIDRKALPVTPRLKEYNDIKKIINEIPNRVWGSSAAKGASIQADKLTSAVDNHGTRPQAAYPKSNNNGGYQVSPKTAAAAAAYDGRIVGLNAIKTTLSSENGESNYTGFNNTLKNRIGNWLSLVQHPSTFR